MTLPLSSTQPRLLAVLAPGDRVCVHDGDGREWIGKVELVARALGTVWIHTEAGERKVLDIHDFLIESC